MPIKKSLIFLGLTKGSASTDKLMAFSPEFENILFEISKPSCTRRNSTLIAERGNMDLLEGISSILILFSKLLLQYCKLTQLTESKLKEAKSSNSNLSWERDQALFSLEVEQNKIINLTQKERMALANVDQLEIRVCEVEGKL